MNRAQKKSNSIDEYIAEFPVPVSEKLKVLRKIIKDEIPLAVETISYGMPTFVLDGNVIVHFAAWKRHIALYPYADEITKKYPEAAEYKTSGKGTIQFPLSKPLPEKLIRQIVLFLFKRSLNIA